MIAKGLVERLQTGENGLSASPLLSVAPDKLHVGMYVHLPSNWLDHPFLRNQFLIKTDKQLSQLRSCRFPAVLVDVSKSCLSDPAVAAICSPDVLDRLSHADSPARVSATDVPASWTPERLIPPQLRDALDSSAMPAEEKSRVVYQYSRQMMQQLLDSPTAENIKAGKRVIGEIADLILSDDQTAQNLLRLTSHDFYTYTHSVNVGVTAIMLCKQLFRRSDAHDLQELGAGFFLHDLGKVKVRAEVINKAGRLTEEEMGHMRIHPYQGYKILKQAGELSEECRYIVMQHHERADGSGYPRHLQGEEIHLYGRICCIADVFDALTAERSYKKGLSTFDALMVMKQEMMNHFDLDLFANFVNLYAD